MDAKLVAIAKSCLNGAHNDTLPFPQIISHLAEAGFDGYHVDFRANFQTYYLSSDDNVTLPLPGPVGQIAARFNADSVAEQVRLAQATDPDYTYDGFCATIREAGCAGYIASISGKRVLYYGRTAGSHVEHFPQ